MWNYYLKQINSLGNVQYKKHIIRNLNIRYCTRPAGTALFDDVTNSLLSLLASHLSDSSKISCVQLRHVGCQTVSQLWGTEQQSDVLFRLVTSAVAWEISRNVFWPGSRLDDRQSRTDRFFLKFPSLGCGGDVAILLAAPQAPALLVWRWTWHSQYYLLLCQCVRSLHIPVLRATAVTLWSVFASSCVPVSTCAFLSYRVPLVLD